MWLLQVFKKISIIEVKGYCYGWYFYQVVDVDLMVCFDDVLFGYVVFCYVGWGLCLWIWIEMMGYCKFCEMLFIGWLFMVQQMDLLGFVNLVVLCDQFEVEIEKYVFVCLFIWLIDMVVVQKIFFEIYKQQCGEYMGSLFVGMIEVMICYMVNDSEIDVEVGVEQFDVGINNVVKDFDMLYLFDFWFLCGNWKKL